MLNVRPAEGTCWKPGLSSSFTLCTLVFSINTYQNYLHVTLLVMKNQWGSEASPSVPTLASPWVPRMGCINMFVWPHVFTKLSKIIISLNLGSVSFRITLAYLLLMAEDIKCPYTFKVSGAALGIHVTGIFKGFAVMSLYD